MDEDAENGDAYIPEKAPFYDTYTLSLIDLSKISKLVDNITEFLNFEDDVLREFGEKLSCNVVYFSGRRVLKSGLYYSDGVIYISDNGSSTKVIDVDELAILGVHNYENAMCAIALGLSMDIPMDRIVDALKKFKSPLSKCLTSSNPYLSITSRSIPPPHANPWYFFVSIPAIFSTFG